MNEFMNNPKVSIIIPVYNGSNYLATAIECALAQTYPNIEILVVNDGSSDDGETERIALSYGERIRYIKKENGGVSSALNMGIREMTGEYFSWLSHDDMYSKDKVQDAVRLLTSHHQLGDKCIAFTSGYFIDVKDRKLNNFPVFFKANKIYDGIQCMKVMTHKGTLNGCCMLIPKYAFDEAGCFHEGLRYSQDSLMWYQLFLAGYSLVADDKPNVMYRLHRTQASQLRRDLFEHDSLAIAKLLAEPLAKIDGTGRLLLRYIKRLTKYRCDEAIKYLYNYAYDNGYLGWMDRFEIKMYTFFGFFRYKIARFYKKVRIRLSR